VFVMLIAKVTPDPAAAVGDGDGWADVGGTVG
jgi:hypothetical protein